MRSRVLSLGAVPLILLALLACWFRVSERPAQAGGAMLVGSPSFGIDAQPVTWDPAAPVQYRVDGGPLSRRPDGTIVWDHDLGVTRLEAMFKVWQDVPTASVSFANAGAILSVGVFTDGDVSTLAELEAVLVASCEDGIQSPVVFDADGALFQSLFGDSGVIGFAGPCKFDASAGRIVAAFAALNGRFQDALDTPWSSPPNYEMTREEFNEVFAHEFGHLIGLDHSQINVNVLDQTYNNCNLNDLAGLPLMFPFAFCQARESAGLPTLAPDDIAWVSRLYPETTNDPPNKIPFASAYGTISGKVLFSDGITHAGGVNVIARLVDDPTTPGINESRRIAFSVVSGYLFTGFPGQNVTTTAPGSTYGSRNPLFIGTFDIPVQPGSYRVEVESINEEFVGGSGVGPISVPIPSPGPNEFWDSGESATDSPTTATPISVSAGATLSGIDIILNGTPPRFDSFESAHLWLHYPQPAWLRRNTCGNEAIEV